VVEATEWLEADGALIVEIAPSQAENVLDLARGSGFADARVERDLTGRDRVLVAQRAGGLARVS
jgi:methylase of polypeptide subunit release factors